MAENTPAAPPLLPEIVPVERSMGELAALLEGLLFVAPEMTPIARLAQILECKLEALEAALTDLAARLREGQRGLRIQRKGDKVQLTSTPETAPYIEKFLGLDLSSKLSAAALETLAVIAHRQPLTRNEVEAIRGVNCDGVLRTLIQRELVESVGRMEAPGRPFLYGTTAQFLQYFGLSSLDDLPPLPDEKTADEKPKT
jgi:segregation and condensation protein B